MANTEEIKLIFSKNLARYSSFKGLQQKDIADICGVSPAAVNSWFKAQKIPRMDKIEKLAIYFGIEKSDLIEEKEKQQIKSNIRSIETDSIYMIPVFDSVSAGFGATPLDYVVDYSPAYIKNPHEVEDMIYINVTGDSMFPKIEDGDKILVKRQTTVDSGSVAVILIDGDEAVVKQVEYGEDWIRLHSFNPIYQDRLFKGEEVLRLRVLGLVKECIKTL